MFILLGGIAAGAVLIAVLVDAALLARDWLGRIRIGKYASRDDWSGAIIAAGSRWLQRTPKVKMTDNTRLVVLDMLRGRYSRSAIQHWQEGALLLGLTDYAALRNSEDVRRRLRRCLEAKLDEGGRWRRRPEHVDAGILAYGLMKAAGDEAGRCKPALDETWELIRRHIGDDGTVMYRLSMPEYRYVDTIGFVCPFLIAYGIRYGKEECVSLAVTQLKEYESRGMLGGHYIPSHAYHIRTGLPGGLYGWGRGLGWFAIGLIDSWMELPDGHEAKPALEAMVRRYAAAVLAHQQPAGHWNWAVNRSEARPDSSATAILGWYLSQASRLPELRAACSEAAARAADYLMKVTRRNGAVDFSQGDTKDIGVYSTQFDLLPFTQGIAIRLASDLARREAS